MIYFGFEGSVCMYHGALHRDEENGRHGSGRGRVGVEGSLCVLLREGRDLYGLKGITGTGTITGTETGRVGKMDPFI